MRWVVSVWPQGGRRSNPGALPRRGAGYYQRTRQNVIDSDGTLIVTFGEPAGGTARTIAVCRRLGKPHLVIDGAQPAEAAAQGALEFTKAHGIRRLNVAGPRASVQPRVQAYAYRLVSVLIGLDRADAAAAAAHW